VHEAAFERMPHRGRMRLIEEILSVDAGRIACRARDHRAEDYPLRLGGRLMTVALVELGAQAAAAHASLHAAGSAHTGLLLALNNLAIHQPECGNVTGPFGIEAELVEALGAAARYRFRVEGDGETLLEGEATLRIETA